MTQQSNAHAERRRRRRDKPGASPLGRIYAVVASPYCCAVGLALLGGLSFAEGVLLLEKTTGTWSADSARAIGVAVVVSSLLAMGIARLVPIMRGVTSASPDAVATDLTLDESEHGLGEIGRELELGRRHSGRFHGIWPAVGVLLLAVALVGFALLPLVRDEGLTRGGQLQLSTAQGTEAAWVVREGIKVRENLGGWRFELNDLDLGPLLTEGGGPEVNAKVKATLVQTGEVSEGVVTPEQPILFGDFIIRLGAVEPTPRPVGLRVQVTDTESGRQFPLSLVVGRAAQDPLGDAVFQVFEIDWDNRNGNGIAARCSLQVGKNQPPKEFWLYEADKDFDARHRKGRFQVAFDKAIAGRRATLLVSQASALEPITGVLLGLLALGTLLLFVSTQISVVRRNDRGVGALDLSSINDGEGLVIMAARLVEAPNPASASDEDDGFDDDEEGYEDDDDEDDDAYEDDEYDDDDDEYEDEDDEEYDDEDEEYEDEEYEDDDEDEDDDDEGDDDDAFDDDEDGDDDEEEVKA